MTIAIRVYCTKLTAHRQQIHCNEKYKSRLLVRKLKEAPLLLEFYENGDNSNA